MSHQALYTLVKLCGHYVNLPSIFRKLAEEIRENSYIYGDTLEYNIAAKFITALLQGEPEQIVGTKDEVVLFLLLMAEVAEDA